MLSFTDPDGLSLALVGVAGAEKEAAWSNGEVPVADAIRGFHGVTLMLDDAALTAAAFVPLPVIAAEAASFDALQLRDEAVLQLKKISVDCGRVHRTDSQVRAFARRRGARSSGL